MMTTILLNDVKTGDRYRVVVTGEEVKIYVVRTVLKRWVQQVLAVAGFAVALAGFIILFCTALDSYARDARACDAALGHTCTIHEIAKWR